MGPRIEVRDQGIQNYKSVIDPELNALIASNQGSVYDIGRNRVHLSVALTQGKRRDKT